MSAFKQVLYQHNVVPPSRSAVMVEGGDAHNLPRHGPEQPAVALALLGARLSQRPLHLPSQSHMPARTAKYDDAGKSQGQQDL